MKLKIRIFTFPTNAVLLSLYPNIYSFVVVVSTTNLDAVEQFRYITLLGRLAAVFPACVLLASAIYPFEMDYHPVGSVKNPPIFSLPFGVMYTKFPGLWIYNIGHLSLFFPCYFVWSTHTHTHSQNPHLIHFTLAVLFYSRITLPRSIGFFCALDSRAESLWNVFLFIPSSTSSSSSSNFVEVYFNANPFNLHGLRTNKRNNFDDCSISIIYVYCSNEYTTKFAFLYTLPAVAWSNRNFQSMQC